MDDISKEEFAAVAAQVYGRNDPVFFGEYFLGINFYPEQKMWLWATTKTQKDKLKILLKDKGICFTTPERFDEDIDHLYNHVDKHIFCVNNQAGKTLMTAVKHLWSCYFKIGKKAQASVLEFDDYKTLNVSPHSDQANKCFEYVKNICLGQIAWFDRKTNQMKSNKPHPEIANFITGVNTVEKEIRFLNNSVFWSKSTGSDSGTARAGEQFGLITFDEGSQSLHMKKTIFELSTRLIRYGYCFDLVSTPEADKAGHPYYMSLVKKGIKLEDGWFALTGISLDDNIFIDPKQIEKAKRSIKETSPEKYAQAILGKFVSVGERLFSLHAVRQMFKDNTTKLEKALPTRKYILTIDWAMADAGDKTWMIVVDYTDWLENKIYIVHHQIIKGGEPYIKYAMARDLYQRFGGRQQCEFIMDGSAMGGSLIKKELADLNPVDFSYNGGKKDEMLMFLNMALTWNRKYEINNITGEITEFEPNFGKIRSYYIPELEEQLANYRTEDKKLEQDGVMSLSQAIWWIEKLPKNIDVELDINPMNRYNNLNKSYSYSRYYHG